MTTHSNIFAWRIPWTEEPGGLHTVHGVAKSRTRLSDFTFPSFWSWLGLASGSSRGHNRGEGTFSLAPSWVWSACPALRRSQLTGRRRRPPSASGSRPYRMTQSHRQSSLPRRVPQRLQSLTSSCFSSFWHNPVCLRVFARHGRSTRHPPETFYALTLRTIPNLPRIRKGVF